jgi:hypothetical protein
MKVGKSRTISDSCADIAKFEIAILSAEFDSFGIVCQFLSDRMLSVPVIGGLHSASICPSCNISSHSLLFVNDWPSVSGDRGIEPFEIESIIIVLPWIWMMQWTKLRMHCLWQIPTATM